MSQNPWQSPISPGISWYEASIGDRPRYAPLGGDCTCDVVIVGGGFSGLSAALHLAKAGVDVVLIEAHRFGDGASGRNGGQLGTGQRAGVLALEKQYGFERSKALFNLAEDAKRNLHEVAADAGFNYDFMQGQLTPMHRQRFENAERTDIDALNDRYDYPHISWLNRDEMAARLGSKHYFGGSRDQGTGHIHPLKYLVGLVTAAAKAGAILHEETPALEIQADHKIIVKTARGQIVAKMGLLAMNAHHNNLEKQTSRHVMPIQSFIAATKPLPENSSVIPGGEAVDDSRFVVRYFRKTADNRLLFGGREIYSSGKPGDIAAGVRRQMLEVFPALRDVEFSHAWGGSVAITMPRMPYIRQVRPGLWSVGGFSGHGVMMSAYCGKLVAEKFLGHSAQLDLLAQLKITPFPGGQALRNPLLFLAMTWYSMLDRI